MLNFILYIPNIAVIVFRFRWTSVVTAYSLLVTTVLTAYFVLKVIAIISDPRNQEGEFFFLADDQEIQKNSSEMILTPLVKRHSVGSLIIKINTTNSPLVNIHNKNQFFNDLFGNNSNTKHISKASDVKAMLSLSLEKLSNISAAMEELRGSLTKLRDDSPSSAGQELRGSMRKLRDDTTSTPVLAMISGDGAVDLSGDVDVSRLNNTKISGKTG